MHAISIHVLKLNKYTLKAYCCFQPFVFTHATLRYKRILVEFLDNVIENNFLVKVDWKSTDG